MNFSLTIRRSLAAFFLLLFSFCVTPKRFLHDLLANHRDAQTIFCISQEQVMAKGFHCHIDDLVVIAPFLPGIQATEPVIPRTGTVYFSEPSYSIVLADLSKVGNRGPPASFCS
jgi:hypothetical protein